MTEGRVSKKVYFQEGSLPWLGPLFLIGCSVRSHVVTFDLFPLPNLPALMGSAFDFPLLIGEDRGRTLDTLALLSHKVFQWTVAVLCSQWGYQFNIE